MFARYVGCDVVRYEGYPEEGEFLQVNFDNERVPLPDGFADVVIAVETIEHLENPRAFLRELTRLTASGGLVLVTTPNNLSLLSKLTLLVKNQFNAFQDSSYPAHLTALLEIDLRRMARECRLVDIRINYSQSGRIPGTARHFPRLLSAWWPRLLSDNVLLIAKKPERPALSSCDQGGNRGPST
jgi:SAM-dependent methyltransferase